MEKHEWIRLQMRCCNMEVNTSLNAGLRYSWFV